MKQCRGCKEFMEENSRFCFNCGKKCDTICPRCHEETQSSYKFCPSCGFALASTSDAIIGDVTCGPSSRPFGGQLTLHQVKEKLQTIKGKRLENQGYSSKKGKTSKEFRNAVQIAPGKATYVLVCGIKEKRFGEWVQMRGRTSPYSAVKKTFLRNASYSDVLDALKGEFSRKDDEILVLVDMENQELQDHESFTIYNYVQEHKKYMGSTRIYLGIKNEEVISPTKVPADDVKKVTSMTFIGGSSKQKKVLNICQSVTTASGNDVKKDAVSHEIQNFSLETQQKKEETQNFSPETQQKKVETQNFRPETQQKKEETQNFRPETQQKKEETQNFRPETQQKKEETQNFSPETQQKKEETQNFSPETQQKQVIGCDNFHDTAFENAINCIKREQEEKNQRGAVGIEQGQLVDVDTSIYCPVHADDPHVLLFMDQKGGYQKVSSGYGEFVCIPHSDMDEFYKFRELLKEDNIFIVNPALVYYLHYVHSAESGRINISSLCDDVWELPEEMAEKYKQWKMSMSENI